VSVSRRSVLAVASIAIVAALPAAARAESEPLVVEPSLALAIERGAKVVIRRVPAGTQLAVAPWRTRFGSVRRLRVVEQRGDWFAVESDVLGNGAIGWVPKTAAVRLERQRFSVEADLSARSLTVRDGQRIVFRRRVSIGGSRSPTPSGRFHVSDHISGTRWGLGCCILVFSGKQPRLPSGWRGGDRLAVHGRPRTARQIGVASSAGCLHATDATLRELVSLPLGTPVVIHP